VAPIRAAMALPWAIDAEFASFAGSTFKAAISVLCRY
jgi:hypothetical protein